MKQSASAYNAVHLALLDFVVQPGGLLVNIDYAVFFARTLWLPLLLSFLVHFIRLRSTLITGHFRVFLGVGHRVALCDAGAGVGGSQTGSSIAGTPRPVRQPFSMRLPPFLHEDLLQLPQSGSVCCPCSSLP